MSTAVKRQRRRSGTGSDVQLVNRRSGGSFFKCSESTDFFMTAQVCVLYFAKSVELTGVKEEEIVAVPTPISSRDLWSLLLQRHPRLLLLQDQVVFAVRHQYVAIGDQVVTLGDGDEVAVVPPLSGG
ncbi:molybdopterin synthase sulfur carrier subunit-like isoform X3 [Anarhichas minor]|uniref:molybdopterin synthase sulfur carrier subunit-like isoform X3 n=1 Tax=Anarhichas minor TaxID=65739 RepID=UPI003F738290